MFGFMEKKFTGLLNECTTGCFGELLASNSKWGIKCVSLNNWSFQARLTFIDINFNKPLYHPFADSVNKCGESCKTADYSYAGVSVPDNVKNISASF